ncbi:MAG: iron transporter [Planctomycetota bacterium]|nr:MAG: iron transporter [Planctomycetota bacterium]
MRARQLLPGLLVAATGVGAGDLVQGGLAGSAVGVTLIWAVLLGGVLKFTLTEGLTRWQLATGSTLLEGWGERLGPWVLGGFALYLVLWSLIVGGALISACGVAAQSLSPWDLGAGSDTQARLLWGALHSVLGLVLVRRGGFAFFERFMTLCIVIMIVGTGWAALRLAPPAAELLDGLVPRVRDGELVHVLALLGGVGGSVTLLSYGYWIAEHGRAGAQGLRVCRVDLGLAYLMTALFGVALLVLGSRTQLHGRGSEVAVQLAEQLGAALGPWGRTVFLFGFWGAVFSSLLGVWHGVPYLAADTLRVLRREARVEGSLVNTRSYRGYQLGLALLPLALLGLELRFETVQRAYAVLSALFMPFLAFTLLRLNGKLSGGFAHGRLARVLLLLTLGLFLELGRRKLFAG